MKCTTDIPDALVKEAKLRAIEDSTTFREVLIAALQNYLFASDANASATVSESTAHDSHIRLDADGWPILVRAEDDTTVITNADVNQMREEMGI